MALKFVVDKLEDVAEPLRSHYAPKDGKFTLSLDGGHPDTARLAEFRDNNVKLTRERDDLATKFKDIDPAAVAANAARVAELEKATPRITELEAALAAEKAARADLQAKTEAAQVESAIGDAFLRHGGRPEARAFIVAQSAGQFSVEQGQVTSNKISPNRPGEPMSIDEFLLLQSRQNAFCFFPSGGGGANPMRGGGGGSSSTRVIRNPSPAQLGDPANARAVKDGSLRFEYDT